MHLSLSLVYTFPFYIILTLFLNNICAFSAH